MESIPPDKVVPEPVTLLAIASVQRLCFTIAVGMKLPLMRVEFAGGSLWSRDRGIPPGHRVRLLVPSSGASISLERHSATNILNSLPGRVETVLDGEHPGISLVQVRIGESKLLARATKRSLAANRDRLSGST